MIVADHISAEICPFVERMVPNSGTPLRTVTLKLFQCAIAVGKLTAKLRVLVWRPGTAVAEPH